MQMHKSLSVVAIMVSLAAGAPAQAGELAEYTVDKSRFAIPESLTGVAGDPVSGRAIAIDRKKGNCLACHQLPVPEEPFHGRIGPPLDVVGARYEADQLRLRVVNPKAVNPMSIMPAFYKVDGLHAVAKDFQGAPILSAQEVEDVIAYLATLQ